MVNLRIEPSLCKQVNSSIETWPVFGQLRQRVQPYIMFDRIDYRKAWELQSDLIIARKERILQNDIVLFLEHPAVFTLGRRGGRECMLVSDKFLEKAGVQVIQVERGGNITFHGPGQLVVYPIVDLQTAGIKVVDFVSGLEEVMLRTVDNWGIAAERNAANRDQAVIDALVEVRNEARALSSCTRS